MQKTTVAAMLLVLTHASTPVDAQETAPSPETASAEEASPVEEAAANAEAEDPTLTQASSQAEESPTRLASPSPVSPGVALGGLGDARWEFGGRLPAPPSRARTEVRRLRRLARQQDREARQAARRQELETQEAAPERKFKLGLTTGVAYTLGGDLGIGVLATLGVGMEHHRGHRLDFIGEFQLIGPDSALFNYRSDRLSLDCGLRVVRLSRRATLLFHATAGLLRTSTTLTEGSASGSSVSWLGSVGAGVGIDVRVHPHVALSFRGGFRLTTPQSTVSIARVIVASTQTQFRYSLAARFTL